LNKLFNTEDFQVIKLTSGVVVLEDDEWKRVLTI
jgi:hypothetical protein